MLSSTDIVSVLQKLPCRCIILVDACDAGGFVDEPGLDPRRHVVMAACKDGEAALEPNLKLTAKYPKLSNLKHSLFTLALLNGLEAPRRSNSISSLDLYEDTHTKLHELLRLLNQPPDTQSPVLFPKEKSIPIAMKLSGDVDVYVTIIFQLQPLAAAACSSFFLPDNDRPVYVPTR
jgi:hypothetical protein